MVFVRAPIKAWGLSAHTEKVDVLIDGVALDGGEAELLNELLADVLNVDLRGTNLQGLLTGSLKVLLLTNIGHCVEVRMSSTFPSVGHDSLKQITS